MPRGGGKAGERAHQKVRQNSSYQNISWKAFQESRCRGREATSDASRQKQSPEIVILDDSDNDDVVVIEESSSDPFLSGSSKALAPKPTTFLRPVSDFPSATRSNPTPWRIPPRNRISRYPRSFEHAPDSSYYAPYPEAPHRGSPVSIPRHRQKIKTRSIIKNIPNISIPSIYKSALPALPPLTINTGSSSPEINPHSRIATLSPSRIDGKPLNGSSSDIFSHSRPIERPTIPGKKSVKFSQRPPVQYQLQLHPDELAEIRQEEIQKQASQSPIGSLLSPTTGFAVEAEKSATASGSFYKGIDNWESFWND